MAVISSMALSCGGTALSQTNSLAPANAGASGSPTNVVTSGSSTNITDLGNVTVVGQLDQARNQILPDLGATAYTIRQESNRQRCRRAAMRR